MYGKHLETVFRRCIEAVPFLATSQFILIHQRCTSIYTWLSGPNLFWGHKTTITVLKNYRRKRITVFISKIICFVFVFPQEPNVIPVYYLLNVLLAYQWMWFQGQIIWIFCMDWNKGLKNKAIKIHIQNGSSNQ